MDSVMLRTAVLGLLLALAGCREGFKVVPDAEPDPGDAGAVEAGRGDRGRDRGKGEAAPPVPGCPGPIVSEDVDTFHDPGQHTSIAVDAGGDLHVSYLASGEPYDMFGNGGYWDARYSVRRGGKWQSEDISTSGVVGAFSALGVGASGEVHAVFYKDGDRDLLHSRRQAGGWTLTQKVLSEGDCGWGNDLAVDGSGTVHVVSFSRPVSGNDQVAYVRRVGASWQTPLVLETHAFDTGPKSGLAVREDGTVHVCVEDALGQLKHRRGKDGVFEPAKIVDSGLGAGACDLAIDGNGDAQIAYYDGQKKVLKFIGQQAGIFGSPTVLDSSGAVGSYHAIAATATGDLWVAYYDFTNLDLKLIRRRGGSWGQPETIDSAGHVGRFVSAALGPDGAIHIAHWNGTQDAHALRYTRVCP